MKGRSSLGSSVLEFGEFARVAVVIVRKPGTCPEFTGTMMKPSHFISIPL
jgi:hypothetical protein